MSLWWDIVYWLKKTPWDTGITPPEIVAMIDSGKVLDRAARSIWAAAPARMRSIWRKKVLR